MPSLRSLVAWPAPPRLPMSPRERWLLLALVLVACALRLVQVRYSFDTDEVFSVRLSSQPFAVMIDGALWDRSHPPLHILLLHFWMKLFGVGEFPARSLSIVCAAGFLPCAHAVARRVAGPVPALALVALIAVSPFFVYYGQQARPYSLIATLSALSLLTFMRAMDRPEVMRRWVAWGVTAALLVYTQYMGVLLLGMEALVAVLCLRRAATWPLVVLAASVLTVLPWVWAAMGEHVVVGDNPLDLILWMPVPGPRDLGFQLVAPFGDGPLRASLVLLFVVAVLVAGVALLVRRRRLDAPRFLVLLVAVGTPVVLFVIARIMELPVFAPRQLIGASFCLLVLLAICLSTFPRAVGSAVFVALVAFAVVAIPSILPSTRNPNWPAIAAYFDVDRNGAPVRSAEPWITDPLAFYRRRGVVYGPMPMSPGADGASSLLLCRAERCRPEDFGPGATPARVWRWGKDSIYEMRVYERAQ